MADALKEALDRMNKSGAPAAGESNAAEDMGEDNESGIHAVHSHDHGGKHSIHKIKDDGTAESEVHDDGQGGDECPFCGGTGKTE